MADSELKKVGIPRNNSFDSHHYGYITKMPGEFSVDGTAPAAFTNDVGTDGTQQDEQLDFAGDADDLAFCQFVVPNDWGGSHVVFRLLWSATDTTGTVMWAGTVRTTPGDDTAVSNIAGQAWTDTAARTVSATTLNIIGTDVDVSSNAEIVVAQPGDLAQIMVIRDVSEDSATNSAFLLGFQVIYSRK